jgi:Secretion system C-terminal sorting domain
MRKLTFIILCLFALVSVKAQGWERIYGTSRTDEPQKVISTLDGGFLLSGYTLESNGDKFDALLIKTDAEGRTQWQRTYGKPNQTERIYTAFANTDGTYFVAGTRNTDTTNGDGLAYLLKINALGDTLWSRSYFPNYCTETFWDIKPLRNGSGFILAGSSCNGTTGRDDILLVKIDNNGNIVFDKRYGDANKYEFPHEVVEASDGGFIMGGVEGLYGLDNQKALVMKTDANGNQLWYKTFGNFKINDCTSLVANTEGGCFATGLLTVDSTQLVTFLKKYKADGTEERSKLLPDVIWGNYLKREDNGNFTIITGNFDGSRLREFVQTDSIGNQLVRKKIRAFSPSDVYRSVAPTRDKGFALLGKRTISNDGQYHLTKLNEAGDIYTFLISGKVYFDKNQNCRLEANEPPITNWLVKAENANKTFWGWTDSLGQYTVATDSGIYRLSLVRPNNYWQACRDSVLFSLSTAAPSTTYDFAVKAKTDCALLDVDITTPLLRRCFENTYYINYCNRGTKTASNALVKITLDKSLTFNASMLPLARRNGQDLFFNLGNIEQGKCGTFQMTATVNCDGTVLGQTHCVEAHIYPDSVCVPVQGWSGASIEVSGACERDSVSFLIRNVGTAPTSTGLKSIIIEDNVVFLRQPITLPPSGTQILKVKATGATYRLTADQEPNHPDLLAGGGNPTVAVEGCRSNAQEPFSLGYVTQFDENDGNPFISVDCHQNYGSYDPNDKQAYPQGIGNQHFIDEKAELDYTIRFQNTGTDTAFTVVVKDTLSSLLDIATLRAGASSHRYQLDILEGRILKFTFNKINLPDSTRNKLKSQGFIKFLVRLKSNIAFGSKIENKAAIYFDFNEPVITNNTFHTLRKPERYNSRNLDLCNGTAYNGKTYPTDTRVYDTLRFTKFDSIVIDHVKILPTYKRSVDTTIRRGQPIGGIVSQRDTNLIIRYSTVKGCDSTVTYRLTILTALEDLYKADIKMYPNPFTDFTTIELPPQYSGSFDIKIYDLTGREVMTKTTQTNKFELARQQLVQGVYLMEIHHNNRRIALTKLSVSN